MKKLLLIGLFYLTFTITNAQQYNLVPNSSFEQYTSCPPPGFINLCFPWVNPTTSTNSGFLTHYFSGCSSNQCCGVPSNIFGTGFQYAKTGIGYASGFMSAAYGGNVRNYLQTQLTKPLDSSKLYYIEFYANLVNRSLYASNNIGLYLSETAPSFLPGQVINVNPQILNFGNSIISDTLNWVKVSGVFKTTKKERFITIGNFKTDVQTDTLMLGFNANACDCSQYNIDDVSVIPLDSICLKADAGLDRSILLGDSVYIGSYTNGIDSLLWLQNGHQRIDSSKPGFFVKPLSNIFYVLQQTVNGCFSSDTVYITVQPSNPLPLHFSSFTVAKSGVNAVQVSFGITQAVHVSHFLVQRSTNGQLFTTIGTLSFTNRFFNKYNFIDDAVVGSNTYYYRIVGVDVDGKQTISSVQSIVLNHFNAAVLKVYPNPAKDYILITSTNKMQHISLYNMYGKIVKEQQASHLTNNVLFRFSEQAGLYILRVVTQEGLVFYQKVIIQ